MAARYPCRLVLVVLFTSLLACPVPLVAQQLRYEYDALGRLTVVSTPEGRVNGTFEGPTHVEASLPPNQSVPPEIASRAGSHSWATSGMMG
jgi:hypothetical protein